VAAVDRSPEGGEKRAMDLKDPKKQKVILSSVLAVALIYVYFVYDYTPKARDVSLKEAHLIGLKQHIKNARARIERSDEEKIRKELYALEQELKRIEELLPLEEEVPLLLTEVERRGLQSGVNSVLFEPRERTVGKLYTEYLYRVSVRGGYHNIGLFLSLVAGMRRIISPMELTLLYLHPNQQKSESLEEPSQVVAQFDMKTYTTNRSGPEDSEVTQ
jgi:type IV pilus assembly protein PilO